ncbi:MAG TPA: hypothetical protein PKC44_12975, partial [Agitococcus sp.]|nr:hypothetical protein [Agitococcus sp.]
MSVNQAPRVNSGTALVNSDGSISVNFQSSDPEGSTMGADAYVMGLNGGFITKKTLNNYASGSSKTIVWSASELKSWNITDGNYYIAIDVFDNKGLQGTRFASNNIVIQPPVNQAPRVNSGTALVNSDG